MCFECGFEIFKACHRRESVLVFLTVFCNWMNQ